MSISGGRWEDLRRDLGTIAARARRTLRRARARRALQRSIGTSLPLLAVAPAAALLEGAVAAILGAPPWRAPAWLLASATVALPLLFLLFRWTRAFFHTAGSTSPLAAVDRQLDLEERLQTAAEFLDHHRSSPFMEAAIADAATHAGRALDEGIAAPAAPATIGALHLLSLAASALLYVGALWWTPGAGTPGDPEGPLPSLPGFARVSIPPSPEDTDTEGDDARNTPAGDPREEARPRREAGHRALARAGDERGTLSGGIKKARGRTGAGEPSRASFAGRAGEARGAPTGQGPSSLDPEKKPATGRGKVPHREAPEGSDAEREKEPEERSGATAGRGTASGSNRSPGASRWHSRDQVMSEEEEELEEDEVVDDELDDSDARGGMQPSLRDRKPPVNRDLAIGYGNEKDPDANGRGGRSEQKKSRGVASLVLGVPIPDHVKGRPNPGKNKVTQERVEPRPEPADSIEAEVRRERAAPAGHHGRPELAPWMREMVKTYFLSLRSAEKRE